MSSKVAGVEQGVVEEVQGDLRGDDRAVGGFSPLHLAPSHSMSFTLTNRFIAGAKTVVPDAGAPLDFFCPAWGFNGHGEQVKRLVEGA